MKNKQLQETLKSLPEDADVKTCYGEDLYSFNHVKLLNKDTIVLSDEYGILSRNY